jgi:hypothetical protein
MGTLQSAEEPLAFVLSSKIKEKLIACFWWMSNCDKMCHRSDNLRYQNFKIHLLCWNKICLQHIFAHLVLKQIVYKNSLLSTRILAEKNDLLWCQVKNHAWKTSKKRANIIDFYISTCTHRHTEPKKAKKQTGLSIDCNCKTYNVLKMCFFWGGYCRAFSRTNHSAHYCPTCRVNIRTLLAG